MDIKELKLKIENKSLNDEFMVWVVEDDYSSIITSQYLNKIASYKHLNIKVIDNLQEIPDESFIIDDNLYVIKCDKWVDTNKHANCIVICKSTNQKDVVKIPKLQDWQVIDYVMSKTKGLEKQDLERALPQYAGNYFRFISDMEKIEIFQPSLQKSMLTQMADDGQFDTLSNLTIWDLSNAILKKDIKTIIDVLKVIQYIDVEPIGLLTVMYKNFKNILNIQLNPSCTAKELNMSDKQFFVVKKYNCGFYSKEQLVKIMKLLTRLEYMYKYEELPMSSLVDYMICNIVGV